MRVTAVGIEFGPELLRFAESLALRDDDLKHRREALLEAAAPAVLVDAVGVAANFLCMTRIADAVGIPVDDRVTGEMGMQVRAELDLERFPSARKFVAA